MEEQGKFNIIILGIIFDPKTKKILIGKRENDPYIPELTWCFPGGELLIGEEIDTALKNKIKLKTGYDVKNLGAFFSKTFPEKKNLLAVYFLTEVFEGKEKAGDDLIELKWVSPKELENYFTTSFHKKLKEYLIDLV
ncbi:MAG: NUDIX hydrolase [Nanoarchaeota archaeon]|nr:NUDIX hydrolase [Nanoarchaeota archaeon]MBU4308736.1 NUDIX hydrolase [Nanoarchaeota archaeon]